MLSQHSKHLNTKRDSEPGTRCMYAHEVPVDQHWSKCPPKAKGGGGVPDAQLHRLCAKRLFKFLLIVCVSDPALSGCTTRGRRYLDDRPQRKCGCAVARSLRGPRKVPACMTLTPQIEQWLIMEIIPQLIAAIFSLLSTS